MRALTIAILLLVTPASAIPIVTVDVDLAAAVRMAPHVVVARFEGSQRYDVERVLRGRVPRGRVNVLPGNHGLRPMVDPDGNWEAPLHHELEDPDAVRTPVVGQRYCLLLTGPASTPQLAAADALLPAPCPRVERLLQSPPVLP